MKLLIQTIDKENPIDTKFMAIAGLCYYAFLRISECKNLNLKIGDIILEETRIIVKVISSKTDQTGRTVQIYIKYFDKPYHPMISELF